MRLEQTPHQVPQRGLDGRTVADVVAPLGASDDVVAEEDWPSGVGAAFGGCARLFVARGAVGREDAAHFERAGKVCWRGGWVGSGIWEGMEEEGEGGRGGGGFSSKGGGIRYSWQQCGTRGLWEDDMIC